MDSQTPEDHRHYWEDFYASPRCARVPRSPSDFASWVHGYVPEEAAIVEIGCGTGRDSVWFAQRGRQVVGSDYSPAALKVAREAALTSEPPVSIELMTLDLYDDASVSEFCSAVATSLHHVVLYARFLMHAVEPEGQRAVIDAAARLLGQDAGAVGLPGALALEFRTTADRAAVHVFGDHFRSYPDPDDIVEWITERGGTVVERVEGLGMAAYGDEDPHVCRIVTRWNS